MGQLSATKHILLLINSLNNMVWTMNNKEIFYQLAKMTTIHTFIAVSSICQGYVSQIDVNFFFLNGDLKRKIYMESPPRFSHNQGEFYKFKKTLYGLKQALHAWFDKFAFIILSLYLCSSGHDLTLFVRTIYHDLILLLLFDDDMIFIGDVINKI